MVLDVKIVLQYPDWLFQVTYSLLTVSQYASNGASSTQTFFWYKDDIFQ